MIGRGLRRSARRVDPDPEGRMPLVEHLRELYKRTMRSAIGLATATVVCFVFHDFLFDVVTEPFETIRQHYAREGATVTLNFGGVADPFTYPLKISLLFGVFLSSPVWLYQLWAFVTPGLHAHERRWAIGFLVVAVPLFVGGAVVAYIFLPKGFDLLVGFNPNPQRVANIIGFDRYLSFVSRMLLVFGAAFVSPVFVVLLNIAGVVSARALLHAWRPVTFGSFVFAAVATPSGDPVTMTVLAVPMVLLYFAAVGVCAITDRRRASAPIDGIDYRSLDDDEASPLPQQPRAVEPATVVDDDAT